jgi:hypothetical protein
VWDQQPTLSDKQNAVWLGYVLARATYIGEHQSHYADVNGPCTPRFDEEVNARFRAARIYRDLAADDKAFRDAYFDDLLAVDKAGFAREYVWTYLHQTSWPETKKPSKLGAFDGWRQTHLASHQVQTYGSIKITPN